MHQRVSRLPNRHRLSASLPCSCDARLRSSGEFFTGRIRMFARRTLNRCHGRGGFHRFRVGPSVATTTKTKVVYDCAHALWLRGISPSRAEAVTCGPQGFIGASGGSAEPSREAGFTTTIATQPAPKGPSESGGAGYCCGTANLAEEAFIRSTVPVCGTPEE